MKTLNTLVFCIVAFFCVGFTAQAQQAPTQPTAQQQTLLVCGKNAYCNILVDQRGRQVAIVQQSEPVVKPIPVKGWFTDPSNGSVTIQIDHPQGYVHIATLASQQTQQTAGVDIDAYNRKLAKRRAAQQTGGFNPSGARKKLREGRALVREIRSVKRDLDRLFN